MKGRQWWRRDGSDGVVGLDMAQAGEGAKEREREEEKKEKKEKKENEKRKEREKKEKQAGSDGFRPRPVLIVLFNFLSLFFLTPV